jgi:ribosomal protein S18 acetylase RimI-like enzyme
VTRYRLRPVEPADAAAIASVHVRVWREAYAGLMPAPYLADLSEQSSAERWGGPEPAGLSRLVAEVLDDEGVVGGVVGMAVAGPTRDEPPDPAHELWSLNVLAAHHGTGLGQQLMDAVLTATAGGAVVSLWVLRGNERARSFYRRNGFAPTAATKEHPPTGTVEERWVRAAR